MNRHQRRRNAVTDRNFKRSKEQRLRKAYAYYVDACFEIDRRAYPLTYELWREYNEQKANKGAEEADTTDPRTD
jgi:hypothetical protein